MKQTYHFFNADNKKKFLRIQTICAIGVIVGFVFVFIWVDGWTNFSLTLDDDVYEEYRTPGECCETKDELKENYRNAREPVILSFLITGVILLFFSYTTYYINKKKLVQYKTNF